MRACVRVVGTIATMQPHVMQRCRKLYPQLGERANKST